MTSYNIISKFRDYMIDNLVREITVIEYRRSGGIWSKKNGQILSHPEFNFMPWACVRVKLFHSDVNGPDFGSRRPGDTSDLFFSCEYDENISLDTSDTQAVLHGFTTDRGYRVDIVAHARTR